MAKGPSTGLAPLFDRLADDSPFQPAERPSAAALVHQALAESVRAELSRLLNTRRDTIPRRAELTVIDYGVADWTGLSSQRETDRRRFATSIVRAITAFEPRLQSPAVEVELLEPKRWALKIRISGHLWLHQERWPVAFVADVTKGMETRIEHERLD
ncbi:type VI secretion system baseplate subunit TssE [Gallaecimonas kandeliae]|uniref:type VI secretion system baseplate subunit TssE n=1 Tax=Gallaecimonas kandeliae TaxID=3029055 RepID=UPI002648E56B|nr:type VI secretion system baseplate subunit TssE [Gallaecimonas kandeliae]WKE64482.1 type VI secretion system baseplate subunit TssE [Gallaecimonas kandeliae]